MQPMVNVALHAARRAGQIITRSADRIDELNVQEKTKNDLVSEVDRQAEVVIIDTINSYYPDHCILAEESGFNQKASEFTWIIDPLDGTMNFLNGIPHHCTSIAIRRGSIIEHGVIVDHLRNEEFFASRGEGSQLNGKRIRSSTTSNLAQATIATGMPWKSQEEYGKIFASISQELAYKGRAVRRMGSAALDLAYVASGRTDAYIEIGVQPWDIAAGSLIVREAGGFITDFIGGETYLTTGNVIASAPRLFKPVARLIRHQIESHHNTKLSVG